jgi:hypothetical protein
MAIGLFRGPRFQLGKLVATPGALEALEEAAQEPSFFIEKHIRGDWGECNADDSAANAAALVDGSRIFSVYRTLRDVKLWVITEAVSDSGNRESTCILLPDEY